MSKKYLAIDLKSFYASVECCDRGLDPLHTHLAVADASKTEKTICLAVSPSLKALGVGGRCRLFELVQAVERANALRQKCAPAGTFSTESVDSRTLAQDPSAKISYVLAKPRMARYLEVSAEIYAVYLRYIAPEDIFAYSIDEVFIDVTGYLNTYRMTAHELAVFLIKEVLKKTGITATCGIGTNLYLAKIAMDILGKRAPADKDGVRIDELDEYNKRAQLWDHRPLTDFWRIGPKTAQKLEKNFLFTMGDVARKSLQNQEWFYKTFGVDAELLIDHAWGVEPTTMEEVQNYKPAAKSICDGQVLTRPYPNALARMTVQEMADHLSCQLAEKNVVTNLLTLDVGYDRENCDNGTYTGTAKIDHYGRAVPPPVHGSVRLDNPTNLSSSLSAALVGLFERITDKRLSVRRLTITASNLTADTGLVQLDLFADLEEIEKEKSMQRAVMEIKKKYGKNAILKGTSLQEGATQRARNEQIGGHQA